MFLFAMNPYYILFVRCSLIFLTIALYCITTFSHKFHAIYMTLWQRTVPVFMYVFYSLFKEGISSNNVHIRLGFHCVYVGVFSKIQVTGPIKLNNSVTQVT